MSTFQHYQFKSTNRPLTEAERQEIDTWSSRTSPSTTAATFTFSYGDFQKKEEEVAEKYFDAILSVTKWGAKRLLFRLPKEGINARILMAHIFEDDASENSIVVHPYESCYLLDINFTSEEEFDGAREGDYDLDKLLPIRVDILQGDNRALYFLWRHFAQRAKASREESGEETEGETKYFPPPVPADLDKASGALKAFKAFFQIGKGIGMF